MEITDEIRELILIGASALELRKKAIEDGMITLRESGLQKIREWRYHDRRSCPRNGGVKGVRTYVTSNQHYRYVLLVSLVVMLPFDQLQPPIICAHSFRPQSRRIDVIRAPGGVAIARRCGVVRRCWRARRAMHRSQCAAAQSSASSCQDRWKPRRAFHRGDDNAESGCAAKQCHCRTAGRAAATNGAAQVFASRRQTCLKLRPRLAVVAPSTGRPTASGQRDNETWSAVRRSPNSGESSSTR